MESPGRAPFAQSQLTLDVFATIKSAHRPMAVRTCLYCDSVCFFLTRRTYFASRNNPAVSKTMLRVTIYQGQHATRRSTAIHVCVRLRAARLIIKEIQQRDTFCFTSQDLSVSKRCSSEYVRGKKLTITTVPSHEMHLPYLAYLMNTFSPSSIPISIVGRSLFLCERRDGGHT